jgi:hypothetical protein
VVLNLVLVLISVLDLGILLSAKMEARTVLSMLNIFKHKSFSADGTFFQDAS